jgi:hypothetical protein
MRNSYAREALFGRNMKALVVTVLVLAAGFGAWLFPWATGAVEPDAPRSNVVPSYALREIRPGPLVPGTAMPTLIRSTDATLREWVPPT